MSSIRIALYEPRIPQNTGNIGRTCAAFKIPLDLICPLGFSLDSRYLKRAGLDYWDYIDLNIHKDFKTFYKSIPGRRLIGFSKTGETKLQKLLFVQNDVLLFGREDIGLPNNVRSHCDVLTSIPMPGEANSEGKNGVRSLNLSSACAIGAYSALFAIKGKTL
ncbi:MULTISPECIES: tRNA (cytidine(34)-2'-O)-methyltransferase [Prochlorococcus]|uniref:tRNA (cytidine(34)-2'-O)-methyltransferase n=1 Tax=Prochlorococcus TaxID=1218 RepID=UPI00053379F9|nr:MULTISPECIES: tRNA (cytidine(34)-2'-O)-methyltransferase [Prochlorococcus]KGG12431.1 tRNA (cytosine34-2'-O-)-methyltransferase [Prochlorococcus sp. MIT 0601]